MGDEFVDNVMVPPELGNFVEYGMPEGDFAEKAQDAMHRFRLAKASLTELLYQFNDMNSDLEHKMGQIRDLLRD